MRVKKDVINALRFAYEYPYDGRNPVHKENLAALAVLANLNDRRGIKQALGDVDTDVREEIVDTLAAIIKASMA